MFGRKQGAQEITPTEGPSPPPVTLLTVVGDTAKMEGKFQIADSIQIECEVGGELRVGGKLVIGEKGVVNANVETVDAIILGHYDGNMTATGNVEIAATGLVRGNIKTNSLVISKGGCFKGNVAKINEEPAVTLQPLYLIEDQPLSRSARGNSPAMSMPSGDDAEASLSAVALLSNRGPVRGAQPEGA
jgi:cytoskeletal protein CcmA (bactofilin family)